MKCELCEKESDHLYRGRCAYCHTMFTGHFCGSREWTDGYIKMTIDAHTNKVKSIWFDHGKITIPDRFISRWGFDPFICLTNLKEYHRLGLVPCTMCQEWIKESEVAHIHFAGLYCAACSIKYKENNLGVCKICGKPQYDCYC